MDITGDAGDNLLDDTAGNDTILGLGGNDTIRFTGGADVIRGGEGDDRVIIDGQPNPGSEFDGGAGTDTLVVGKLITQGTFPQIMFPQGLPTFSGSLITATVNSFERVEFASVAGTVTSLGVRFGYNTGGTGNTQYVSQIGTGISATAEIVGGAGFDTLGLVANHTVDVPPGGYVLDAPNFTYTNWQTPTRAYLPGDRVNIVQHGQASGVINGSSHAGVQGLFGGGGHDTINGSDDMDFISGGAGANQLYGGGGDDALALINTVTYRDGWPQQPATHYTGEGSLFDGGDGFDFLVLGGVVDFQGTVQNIEGICLTPGYIHPQLGATSQLATRVSVSGDVLAQFPTDLEIDGVGTIVIELANGDGFDGSDLTFTPGAQITFEITAGEFGETITGSAATDLIDGGGGNDALTGGGGDDEIDGGEGNDTAYFADALGDCTISYEGNVVIVATKTQGTDRIENVETLNFAGVAMPVQIPVDTIPPTVTITDDKPGVSTGAVTYTLAFSENVTGLSADDFVVTGGNGGGVSLINGADKHWTVLIIPAAQFEGTMGVTLKAGAVTDAQGNPNAAVTFAPQTVDTKPPTVVSRSPANGSEGVRVDADITLTFSEAIQRGHGTITLHRYGVGQIEVFDVATSDRITVAGNTVTIDPTDEFVREGGYFIEAFGNTITDLAGNGFFGIESSYTSSFTVAGIAPSRLFTAPGLAASIGGKSQVIGTAGFQDVTLLDVAGTITLDPSFNKGGDVIRLTRNAADYTIARLGSSALISDGDSEVVVPIGTVGVAIVFADGARELVYDPISGKLTIGDQWFYNTAQIIAAPDGTALPTGADPAAVGRLYLAEDSTIAAAGDLAVIGSNRTEHLTLLGGDLTLDPSFNRGGDTVAFAQAAGAFTAARSGSSVVLSGAEGSVRIPVGTAGMTLDFDGDARTLVFVAGEVRIDDQVIPFTGVTLG